MATSMNVLPGYLKIVSCPGDTDPNPAPYPTPLVTILGRNSKWMLYDSESSETPSIQTVMDLGGRCSEQVSSFEMIPALVSAARINKLVTSDRIRETLRNSGTIGEICRALLWLLNMDGRYVMHVKRDPFEVFPKLYAFGRRLCTECRIWSFDAYYTPFRTGTTLNGALVDWALRGISWQLQLPIEPNLLRPSLAMIPKTLSAESEVGETVGVLWQLPGESIVHFSGRGLINNPWVHAKKLVRQFGEHCDVQVRLFLATARPSGIFYTHIIEKPSGKMTMTWEDWICRCGHVVGKHPRGFNGGTMIVAFREKINGAIKV